jgi:hypothetical protein
MILNIASVIVTAAGPFTLTLQASNIIEVLSIGASPVPLSNFGHDLALTTDEDPAQSEVDGWPCLAQALVRRLQCEQGQLPGDPNYGYDLLGEIDDDLDLGDAAQIGASIDAEFIKDQRVQSSTTTVTLAPGAQVANVGAAVSPAPPPFVPPAGLVRWIDASMASTVTLVAGNVAAIADRSGNGNGYAQATTGLQPPYTTAAVKGLNAIDTRASVNAYLQATTNQSAVLTGTAACRVMVIAASASQSAGTGRFGSATGSATAGTYMPYLDGNVYDEYASSVRKSVGAILPTSACVAVETSSSTEWTFYVNGAVVFTTASNTYGTQAAPALLLGDGAGYWSGLFCESLEFDNVPSGPDLTSVVSYLTGKWL